MVLGQGRQGRGMEYVPAKTIVTKTKSSDWFGIDYNMNIYRGCCHGCIYCDSRSECYRIDRFDTVRAKENALPIIRDDLRRKVKKGVVGTGSMSDPYNPFERELELTRHALELVDAFGFGAAIATKSDLIVRDMDILGQIREHSPVLCKITVTTTDEALAQKIESGAPSPKRRLEAVAALRKNGIFAGILLMPVLPFLEDSLTNVLGVVEAAHSVGANFIYPAFGMTLRTNQRVWYFEKLQALFGDKDYPAQYRQTFGSQYQCTSPNARKLWTAFSRKCEEYHILYRMKDIVHAYKGSYTDGQLDLFSCYESSKTYK